MFIYDLSDIIRLAISGLCIVGGLLCLLFKALRMNSSPKKPDED